MRVVRGRSLKSRWAPGRLATTTYRRRVERGATGLALMPPLRRHRRGTATNVALAKRPLNTPRSGALHRTSASMATCPISLTRGGQNLPGTWEVNLGTNYGIERVVLITFGLCASRWRDIRVTIIDSNGTTNTPPLS